MRRICAVARNTISQGLRMKVALILVVFLVVVIPALPLLLKSDGSATGQAQIILTYSLNVASFMICLLTIFLSVATLADDIRGRHVFVMDITPLRRWELLTGKWLGIVLLCTALLGLMGTAIYVLVKTVVTTSEETDAMALRNEIFTARARIKPEPPDTMAIARQWYDRFSRDGTLEKDHDPKFTLLAIERFVRKHANTQISRMPRTWKFTGLPLPESPEEKIFVRYKVRPSQTPPDGTLRCIWYIGDRKAEGIQVRAKEKAGSLHEFSVPASLIKPDGSLDVAFVCVDDTTVIFDNDKGLEVLYRAGSFEANFVKCLLFIVMKIGFLAAAGLAAATFLTFPVASLAVLFILLVASISGQASLIIKESGWVLDEAPAAKAFTAMVQGIWWFLGLIFPDFARYGGISRVSAGELIGVMDVLKAAAGLELLRGGALMALGAAILHRRELAEAQE